MRKIIFITLFALFINTFQDGTVMAASSMLHNSDNLGNASYGPWGVSGGKYGEFVCETCHTKSTTNIKQIRTTIDSPNGTDTWPNGLTTTNSIIFTQADGTNSDMGDADAAGGWTGICNVCHDNTNHSNYSYNASNGHETNKDCIECHPHSEGFKGSGDCISCHSVEQSSTRRVVTGASGYFVKNSHHVTDGTTTEIVTVAACIVCHGDLMTISHPGSAPSDPQIELKDPDSGTISTYDISADASALEPFCIGCHDSDGYLTNNTLPFDAATGGADTNSPVDIGWTSGMMSHSAPANPDACMGCHGNSDAAGGTLDPLVNAHGSGIAYLLSDTIDGETVTNFEEGLCYACHDTDGLALTDIEAMFAGTETATSNSGALNNSHHDVSDADQAYSGAVIECSDCHDHHTATSSAQVLSDPDPNDGRIPAADNTWTGSTFISEFCLDCHDNSFPLSVTPPTNAMVDIYDRWTDTGGGDKSDQHGPSDGSNNPNLRAGSGYAKGDIMQCTDCHNAGHGREAGGNTYTNLFNLKPVIYSKDGTTPLTPDDTTNGNIVMITDTTADNADPLTNGKNWCSTCHPNPMGGNKDKGCLSGNCHAHGESSF
jgi:hypothetical protein